MKAIRFIAICCSFVIFTIWNSSGQTSTSVEDLTSVSSTTVKGGLGFNMTNPSNDWEFQMAAAGGSTEARFQPGWGAVQNMSGVFSMPATDEAGLTSCTTYGIKPLLLAAFGAPYKSLGDFTTYQAYAAGVTQIRFNQSLASVGISIPSTHVMGTNGDQLVADGKWGYYGALITAVDTSTNTITLASKTTVALTSGESLRLNLLLYPSCATQSSTDASVVAYANYAEFLGSRIAAHSLTGRVELWNEPAWAHDPWDHRGAFYDTVPNGIDNSDPNFGFAQNLAPTTPSAGVHYNWGGTEKSGNPSLLNTSLMVPNNLTASQVATSMASEAFHPYGNTPEDQMWYPAALATANSSQIFATALPGSNQGSNLKLGVWRNLQVPTWNFKQNITETGLYFHETATDLHKTRFVIRQYLGWLAMGLERVTFYCFAQPDAAVAPFTSTGNAAYAAGVSSITFSPLPSGLVLGDVFTSGTGIPYAASVTAINTTTGVVTFSGTTTQAGAAGQTIMFDGNPTFGFIDQNHVDVNNQHLKTQAYIAIQGLVHDDMSEIPVAPLSYTGSNLPSVPTYSGTYPLATVSIVGRRNASDTQNMIYYCAWQQSMAPPGPITNLAVTSTTGHISLSWSQNAYSVNSTLKRATTSGGTYTTLASNLTATTYTDSTVTLGTTYYYVLVGNNPGGTSTNSNEVSADAVASPGSGTFNNLSLKPGAVQTSWSTIAQPTGVNINVQLPAGYTAIDAWDLVTRVEVPFTVSGSTATYPVSDNPICLKVVPAAFFAQFNSDTVGSAPTIATYSSTAVNLKPTAALVSVGNGTLTVISSLTGLTDQPVQFFKQGLADYRPDLQFLTPSGTHLATTSGTVAMEWDECITSFTVGAHSTETLLTNHILSNGSIPLSLNFVVNSTSGGIIGFSPGNGSDSQPAWTFGTPIHFKLVLNLTAGTYSAWANGAPFATNRTLSLSNIDGLSIEDGSSVGGYDGTWNALIDNVWISTGLY